MGQVVELHFKSCGSNLTVGVSHQALQCTTVFIAMLGVRLGALFSVHGEELAARGGRLVYKEGAVPAAGGS